MSGRFMVTAVWVLVAAGCTLFGAGDRTSAPRTASAGEAIDSTDAGPLCWDSSNVFLCINGGFKQCAAVPGEGCVRCTCALGTPSTVNRLGGTSPIWSDRADQNLMGQPRVP
jgi:hypothetical protein